MAVLVVLAFCFAAPWVRAQDANAVEETERFNVGVFADYFRLPRTNPPLNMVGVGARAGVNLSPSWQLEAEMSFEFGTFKGGFVNFSTSNLNVPQGFTSSLGAVTAGETRPAIYPGAGLETFHGPLGLRVEAGVDVYFDHGAHSNFKASFGPVFRF
jgi:hypothetical protein